MKERGIGKLTLLVFGSIIGALIYCGFAILPFFYYYYETQNQFESMVRIAAVEKDSEIRSKLWHQIKKMGIPVKAEDLKIYRDSHTITISLKYTEVFRIPWKDRDIVVKEFPFFAYAKGELK